MIRPTMTRASALVQGIWLTGMFLVVTSLLAACGGGGGGDGAGPGATPPADVSGTWAIHETIDDHACNGTGDTADYSISVTQQGNQITVVAGANTFHGTVNGNSIGWTGQYSDASLGGYVTITSMTVTVNGASLSGSAHWDFRTTQSGTVACSGTTAVSGTRVTTTTAPSAPSGLSAQALSESSIRLSWSDGSSNESGFKIERATGAQGPFAQVGTVNAGIVQFTDTGLAASTIYQYRVRAYNGSGDSAYTAAVSAATLPPSTTIPAAPSQLSSPVTSTSTIVLAWVDNATNEQGFKIQRATAVGGPFTQVATTAANQANYTDTGLAAGTTYQYRVVAYNSAGDSAASNTITVATAVVALPAPPANLTAAAVSSSSIVLNWTDLANNETGYKVERGTAGAGPFAPVATVGVNAQAYTDTGLAAATAYFYRVRATNAAGDSANSNVASATTSSPATAPVAPSNATVGSITTSSAVMSWTDNANNEAGFEIGTCAGLTSIDGLGTLRCATGFTVTRQLAANATSVSLTGLAPSTQYSFFVRATNSAGASNNVGVHFTTSAAATTVTLNSQFDNLVMVNSTIPATANTVNQTAELAVGCNWTYSLVTGLQDFVCAQSLVKFDVSTLAGKTIDSATLTLTVNYRGVGFFPRNWHVWAIASSWSPATATWNTVSTSSFLHYTASEIIQAPPTFAGQVYSINVRSIVQNWANGIFNNNGLMFGSEDNSFPFATSFDAFAFYSREDAAGGGPKLTVSFH